MRGLFITLLMLAGCSTPPDKGPESIEVSFEDVETICYIRMRTFDAPYQRKKFCKASGRKDDCDPTDDEWKKVIETEIGKECLQ